MQHLVEVLRVKQRADEDLYDRLYTCLPATTVQLLNSFRLQCLHQTSSTLTVQVVSWMKHFEDLLKLAATETEDGDPGVGRSNTLMLPSSGGWMRLALSVLMLWCFLEEPCMAFWDRIVVPLFKKEDQIVCSKPEVSHSTASLVKCTSGYWRREVDRQLNL